LEIKLTKNVVICALVGIGISILLVTALVHYESKQAALEAESATIRKLAQQSEEKSKQDIQQIRDDAKAQVDALKEETKSIKDSQSALMFLVKNIPSAKPIIIHDPSKPETKPNTPIPDAPSATIKKDDLVCYDVTGQIALAKYSQSCKETAIRLDASDAIIQKKDDIIKQKDSEIGALEREKHPGFWRSAWRVTKIAAPIAAGAYAVGVAQGRKKGK
jgi:hypothetical protein